MGHHPEIFLDFPWAPSPSRETTATFSQLLRDLAILLTRSWGENEHGFLIKMPLGKAIVTKQLYTHHSVEEALRKAEEAEVKAVKAVDLWRESPEFDTLAQDGHMIVLEEIIKHIRRERPEFDGEVLGEVERRTAEAI